MNKEEYRLQLKEWLSSIQPAIQDDNIRQKVDHLWFSMDDEHSSEQEWYELAERIAEDMNPQEDMREVAAGSHKFCSSPLPV